jgi:hypothetical protein
VEVGGKGGVEDGGERKRGDGAWRQEENEGWSVEVRGKGGVERGGERKRRGGAWR